MDHVHRCRAGCGLASSSTALQRQAHVDFDVGPPTPVETLEERNGRVVLDRNLTAVNLSDSYVLFRITDNGSIDDDRVTGSKGRNVGIEGIVLDTDASNRGLPQKGCTYEQPGVFNA
jgi:hypothetical protein